MYKFDFSYAEYQKFLQICPFSDEEKEIIRLRRKGESNISICRKLSMSETALWRRIKKIQAKIAKEI